MEQTERKIRLGKMGRRDPREVCTTEGERGTSITTDLFTGEEPHQPLTWSL